MTRHVYLNFQNLPASLLFSIALIKVSIASTDERIWVEDTQINGKPVKLCFDSGANACALSQRAVQRLGLKFNPAPTNDSSPGFLAGDVEGSLSIKGAQGQATFMVLNVPSYVNADFDGLIGWPALSDDIVRIDASAKKITFLSKVPRKEAGWDQFSVMTNWGTLELEVRHDERSKGVISIDTGMDGGIELPSGEWRQWKQAHPNCAITLKTFYTPTDGFVVREEAWASQISIGSLVLTDVPIMEERPSAVARLGDQGARTLGLAALSRLNLVVDGKNAVAYLQPKTAHAPVYPHNRLGAVFVPTSTHTNEGVAIVVAGSPAYEAGVRNGDILLQVDAVPVIGWTDDWLSRFGMPPGTKLHLRLRRDGKEYNTVAVLRQIIP